MRRWMKMLLAAGLVGAAGACGQGERLTAPDAGRPAMDAGSVPGDGGQAPRDGTTPPADSTGRWGGGLGSGT